MTRTGDLPPLGLLILLRLLPAGEKGETRAKLDKDLHALWRHRLEGAAWAEPLGRALADRAEAGDLARRAKGKAEQLTLTPEGRRVALEALGLDALPPRTTWAAIKKGPLVALALGRPPGDANRVSAAPGLKTELLRARYGLTLDERPTPRQAADALAGTLLGLEPGTPFTTDGVLAALLRREGIDLPAGKKPTAPLIQEALFRRELGDPSAKKPLDALAARAVGARKGQAGELAEAAVRAWIDRTEAEAAPAAMPLGEFAAKVEKAARASETGRFGGGKVFIAHVWRALRDAPAFRAMGESAFKARLAEAHRARWLELGRADLVEAMDPDDVRESATPLENVVYHFVRTEGPTR